MNKSKSYIAIDLKSFYASVECRERNRDPLTTNLVVADPSRTEKTICLAVSPSLKKYGLSGRARLFEIIQKVKAANNIRKIKAPNHVFCGFSDDSLELQKNPSLKIDYITAPPRMARYMEYSTKIYNIYLKYIAPDKNGVRIAELDEMSYRRLLWNHRPLTDFLRVGRGYSKKLEKIGLYTMGDIARCSIGKPTDYYNEELLYKLFGINAELLIDHAWGYEPCTMEDVKAYQPETNSISSGQVLHCPYEFDKARLVVKEMTDLMVLDLVNKGLVTNQIVLTIGYDIENITDKNRSRNYKGTVTTNYYGKKVPKPAHGTTNLPKQTSSTTLITNAVMELYDKIVNKKLLIRRINIVANKLVDEHSVKNANKYEQLDLFTDYEILKKQREKENAESEREKRMQNTILDIKKKFGKNAILKGMNLQEGATAKDRNNQIGGHKA